MSGVPTAKRGDVSKGNGCCERRGYKPYEICRHKVELSPAQKYVRSAMQSPCARMYAYHEVGSGKTKLGLMTAHRLAYERRAAVVDGVIYAAPLQKDVTSVIAELFDEGKTVDDQKKPIIDKWAFHREMIGDGYSSAVIDGGKLPAAKRITATHKAKPPFYINTHKIVANLLMQYNGIDFKRRNHFMVKNTATSEFLPWIKHVRTLLHNKLVIIDEGHKGVEDGYGDLREGKSIPDASLILFALMFAPASTRILIMSATPYAPSKANQRALGGLGVQLLPLMLPPNSECDALKRDELPNIDRIRKMAATWTPSRLEQENLLLNATGTFNYGNQNFGNESPESKSPGITASLMRRAMGDEDSVALQVDTLLRKVEYEPSVLLREYERQAEAHNYSSPDPASVSAKLDQLSRYFQALYLSDRGESNGQLRRHAKALVSFFKTSGDATLFPKVRFAPCANDSTTGAGCVLRIACPIAPIHQFLIRKPAMQHSTLQLMQRRLLVSMQTNKEIIKPNNDKPSPAAFGAALLSAYSNSPTLVAGILDVVEYKPPESKNSTTSEDYTMKKAAWIQRFLETITRLPQGRRNKEVLNQALQKKFALGVGDMKKKDDIAAAQHSNILSGCMRNNNNTRSVDSRNNAFAGTKGCTQISTYFLPFILRWVDAPANELINLPEKMQKVTIKELVGKLIDENRADRALAEALKSSADTLNAMKKLDKLLVPTTIAKYNDIREWQQAVKKPELSELLSKFPPKMKMLTLQKKILALKTEAEKQGKQTTSEKEIIYERRTRIARLVHSWLSKFLTRIGSDASKGSGINPQQMLKLRHGSVMKGERDLRKLETLARKPDGMTQLEFGQYYAMGGAPDKLRLGKSSQWEVPAYALYSMKIFMAAHIIHASTLPVVRTQDNADAWKRPTIPTSGQSDKAGNIMLYFDPSLRKQFFGDQARTSEGVATDGTKGGVLRTLIDQECCVAIITPVPQGKEPIQQCFAVFATSNESTSYKYWTKERGRNLSVGLVESVKYRKLAANLAELKDKQNEVLARRNADRLQDKASLNVYREYVDGYLSSIRKALYDTTVDDIVVLGGENSAAALRARRTGEVGEAYAGFRTGTDLMTGDGTRRGKTSILDRVRRIGFVHDKRFTRLYTILTHLLDKTAHKDLMELRRKQAASEMTPKSDEERQQHERFVSDVWRLFKQFEKSCEKYVDEIVVMIRKERSSLLSPRRRSHPFLCVFDQALASTQTATGKKEESPSAKIVKVYNLPQNVTGDLLNVVCSNATHGTSFMETLTAIMLHQTQGGMPISPSQLQQIVGRITRRCSTRLHYIPRRGMPEIRIYSLVSTSLNDIVSTREQKVRKTPRVSGSPGSGGGVDGSNENGPIKQLGFQMRADFDRQAMRSPETLIPNTIKMLSRYPFPWFNPKHKDKQIALENSLQQFYKGLLTGAQAMCRNGDGRALQITSTDECKSSDSPTTRPFFVLQPQTLDQTASAKPGVERFMKKVENHARNRSLFKNYIASLSAMNVEDIATSEEIDVLATLLRAGVSDGVVRKTPKMGTPFSKYRPPSGVNNNNGSNGLEEKLAQVAFRMTPRAANAISMVKSALSKPRGPVAGLKVVKSSRKSAPSVTLVKYDTEKEITKGILALLEGGKIVDEDVREAFNKKLKAYKYQKMPRQELTPKQLQDMKEVMQDALSDGDFIRAYGGTFPAFQALVASSNEDVALFFESGGGGQTDKPPPGWRQTRVSTRGGGSFLAYSKDGQLPEFKDKKISTISALSRHLKQQDRLSGPERQWLERYGKIEKLRLKGIVLRNTPFSSEDATKVAVRAQNTRSLTTIMNEKRAQFNNKNTQSQAEQLAPDPLLWRVFLLNGQLRYLPKNNNSSSIGEDYMTDAEVLAIIARKGKSASSKEKQWKQNMEARLAAEDNKQRFKPASESFLQKMKVMNDSKKLARVGRSVSTNSKSSTSIVPHVLGLISPDDIETVPSRTTSTSKSLPDPSFSVEDLIKERIAPTPNTWQLMPGRLKRYERISNGQIATMPGSDKPIKNPKGLADMLKKSGTDSEKKWAGRYLKFEEFKAAEKEFDNYAKKLQKLSARRRPDSFRVSMQPSSFVEEKQKQLPKKLPKKAKSPIKSKPMTPQERFEMEMLKKRINRQKTRRPWVGYGKNGGDSLNAPLQSDFTMNELRALQEFEKKERLKVVDGVRSRQNKDERSLTNMLQQAFVPYRQFRFGPEKNTSKTNILDPASVPNRSKRPFARERNELTSKSKRAEAWRIRKSLSPPTAFPRKVVFYPKGKQSLGSASRIPLANQSPTQMEKYKKRVKKMTDALETAVQKKSEKAAHAWVMQYKKSNAPNVKYMANALTNKNMGAWRDMYLQASMPDIADKVATAEALANARFKETRAAIEKRLMATAKAENTQMEKYKARVKKMTDALEKAVEKRSEKAAHEWVMQYKKSNAPNVKYMANALTNKNMGAWRDMYLKAPMPDIADKVATAEALANARFKETVMATAKAENKRLIATAKAEKDQLTKAKPNKAVAPNGTSTAPKRARVNKTNLAAVQKNIREKLALRDVFQKRGLKLAYQTGIDELPDDLKAQVARLMQTVQFKKNHKENESVIMKIQEKLPDWQPSYLPPR